eukprot:3782763-Amphidinium_carterae.1
MLRKLFPAFQRLARDAHWSVRKAALAIEGTKLNSTGHEPISYKVDAEERENVLIQQQSASDPHPGAVGL